MEAITPKCLLKEVTRTIKSEMSSALARSGEGKGDSRIRAAVSRNKVKSNVSKKQLSLEERRQAKRDCGLFLCDTCCPLNGRYCRGVFLQELRCTRHSEKDKHTFPTGMRARDWILKKASDPGGLVATGSRVDRSIQTVTGTTVGSTNIIPEMMARCKGQFNRKEAATPYKKPKNF